MAQLLPVDGDPFAAGGAQLVPVDGDPFAGAAMVPVDHDPFAEAPVAPKKEAELRAYEPTMREKLAHMIAGDDPFSMRAKVANALVGSTGLGKTGTVNVADLTPASVPLLAQEAGRSFEQGNTLQGALEAVGAAAPLAGAGVRAYASSAAKALEAATPVLEAADRAGVTLPKGVDSRAAVALKEAPIPKVFGGNPVPKRADEALAQIDEAAANVSRANAVPPLSGQTSLRDWLMSADEAQKPITEAADALPAPVAPAVVEPANAVPGLKAGPDGAFRVVTPDNSMEIAARPQVVELSDLKLAQGDLQPRDRSRVEYLTGTLERANRLDPAQLQPSRVSDSGAPIVGPDGRILSGNGRAQSIAHVYSNPALADRAAAYRESLGPEAANMRHPVLIMRADAMDPTEAARFADLSNRGRIAAMSATERAARDAKALGADGVSLYQGGDFEAPQNQAFLRHFMEKAATAGERPSISNGGRLTQEGVQRMRNAVLASAYDDPGVLSKMLESSDDNIRNLTGALSDAAPKFAVLKADISAGHVMPEMDATPQIMDAVKKIADLRANGTTADRWFAQMDAFDDTDPIVKEWVRAFHTPDLARPASRQQMAEVLNAYATEAGKHAPGGLFEDTTKSADVLNVARKASNENAGTAEAIGTNQAASNGTSNAARGIEALQPEAAASGEGAIQTRGQAGNGTGAKAGDASQAEAGDLSRYLPKKKTAQEIVFAAKKAQLGEALGLQGEVLPSRAMARIEELVASGSANDTASLLKAKSLLGNDAWQNVSGSVLTRLGVGSDFAAFAEKWTALPANSRTALVGGEARQAIDDVVTLLGKRDALARLSNTASKRALMRLGTVPYIGPLVASKLSTKLGDAVAHVGIGYAVDGTTLAGSVAAKTVGAFLMRPASAKATARWLSAYQALSSEKTKQTATAFALASRMLAKVVAEESGADERDVAEKLQAVGGE